MSVFCELQRSICFLQVKIHAVSSNKGGFGKITRTDTEKNQLFHLEGQIKIVNASQDCVVHTGMCMTIHVDLETFFPLLLCLTKEFCLFFLTCKYVLWRWDSTVALEHD